MAVSNEDDLVKSALAQLLRQDICTSILDTSLTYRISPSLLNEYNFVYGLLMNFSKAPDFRQEQTNLQLVAIKYRVLMSRTLDEFISTNADINRVSPDQMTFIQNLIIMGGKLQSYTQLLATASNQTKIYNRIHEAAILNEIDGQDALNYLRRNKDSSDSTTNPERQDIKELVTTSNTFDSLYGIDPIVNEIKQTLVNIQIGLVDSFLFFILYGIPGTGKTAISEALATQFSNGEYYKFDQSFFASTFLGVTESRIRNIFETVRSNPNKNYTIIIDEADNVMRPKPAQDHLNSIKILLQTEVSSYNSFGPNLVIIAITNYLNEIDQTFRRRSTNIINVPAPTGKMCLEFLERQLTFEPSRFQVRYRVKLELAPHLVYTNSDMGRLAKNVQDNFLGGEDSVEIRLYPDIQLFYMFSSTDSSASPDKLPEGDVAMEKIVAPYPEAMVQLAAALARNNTTLRSFKKYLAPSVENMNKALASASTLTHNESLKYKV